MHKTRLLNFILSTIMAFAMITAMAEENEKPETVISELAWGGTLFDYFSGEPLQAITRLTARIQQGQIQNHKDEADLLLAGMYLDYGMPNKAAEKLALINIDLLSPRLASKMFLANARVYYQQQDFTTAESALAKVNSDILSDKDRNLAAFIRAQIFFSTGRYAEAAATLSKVSDNSNLQLYANYNLGLSLLQLKDKTSQSRAIGLLNNLSSMAVYDQEQYALADQAKLALALFAIERGDELYAELYLTDIRLDGLVSKDALLLLGWNYAKQDNYEQALVYWQALAEDSDILSPVVQEAWLAVPYAWQQGGDKNRALAGYQFAFELQTKAQQELQKIKSSPLWAGFISENAAQTSLKEYPAFYRELTADPKFHELLNQWHELQQLKIHLNKQSRRIPVLELSVSENQQRYLEKTESVKEQLAQISINAFEAKVHNFEEQLAEQREQAIAVKLLPHKDYEIWRRIERSEINLAAIKASPTTNLEDLARKQQNLSLLKGVAKWQFHRDRPQHEWQAVKSQRELEQAYSNLRVRHSQLNDQITSLRPALTMDVKQLRDMVARGNVLLSEITTLQQDITTSMANIYQQIISRRLLALEQLAEQANLAIARLNYELATEEYRRD